MPIGFDSGVTSSIVQQQLARTNSSLRSNMQSLSTGLRINSASDDAAGLAVSEGLKSDIRSLGQAAQNTSDGISVAQTAEGGMQQAGDILGRMKELATQANNDTLSDQQRQDINEEFQQLGSELQDISENTDFNGQQLLNGDFSGSFQVGEDAEDSLNIAISQNFDGSFLGEEFDATGQSISGSTISFGSTSAAQQFAEGQNFTLQGSGGTVEDVEVTNISGQQVQFSGAVSGQGLTAGESLDTVGSVEGASLSTQEGASFAATAIDGAISQVTEARSRIGATQNRFEEQANSISQSRQSLTAANSQIADADIARQVSELTQNQILQQSGTSMLTQANSFPETALQLLSGGGG